MVLDIRNLGKLMMTKLSMSFSFNTNWTALHTQTKMKFLNCFKKEHPSTEPSIDHQNKMDTRFGAETKGVDVVDAFADRVKRRLCRSYITKLVSEVFYANT
ncbi:hypothetical protein AWENTII_006028 [Aspergillus wentii]